MEGFIFDSRNDIFYDVTRKERSGKKAVEDLWII